MSATHRTSLSRTETARTRARARAALGALPALALLALLALHGAAGCGAPEERVDRGKATAGDPIAAWEVVYDVLQHPRCLNCHPAGSVPLQGEESRPHAQSVARGADGTGRSAMRCATCHQESNIGPSPLPPGAPHWHLPHPRTPLIFEGRSSGELCRQLADPARNGGKSPEEIVRHMTEDPLVLWGWDPGEGRAPVPTPHAEVVAALRTWVDGGCACPE